MDHRVETNGSDGSARVSIPLPTTRGREGFGPSLGLVHTGRSNSPFGFGWSLTGVPTIGVSARDGFPTYREGDQRFVLSGGRELVAVREERSGEWQPVVRIEGDVRIERYRLKVERAYERIERHIHPGGREFWILTDRNGVSSVFGRRKDGSSRIADPSDPRRTYQWMLDARYDRKGNAIRFEYAPEDGSGVDFDAPHERGGLDGFAQRYLVRIRYGNVAPVSPGDDLPADDGSWRFAVAFDYGQHPDAPVAAHDDSGTWDVRPDPYTVHRPGFEVRTYRRCRRVLMFHRFDELGDTPTLVSSVELEYGDDPAGGMLQAVRRRGFRRLDDGSYEEATSPRLRLQYAEPEIATSFEEAPRTSQTNVPAGVDGAGYRFFDLRGEGLPGILMRRGGSWYFKENLGQGSFGPMEQVDSLPAGLSAALQLQDFDGDGNPDLVTFSGREAGRFTRDRDEKKWGGYRTFDTSARADFANASPHFADLNGDGYADVIVDRHDRFVWFPSRRGDGFEEPREIARPEGLPTVRPDGRRFFFADMSGDGLVDMVRVSNGRVEYWPHLGNGEFGAPVLMSRSPRFDSDDAFDPRRLRFVDLDRSGSADLLYLGRGELRWWSNHRGDAFGDEQVMGGLPFIDRLSSVQVLDFLGDGGRCLVWSSSLPTSEGLAIRYLRLSGEVPARTLQRVDNGCGRVTRFTHRFSTTDYLRDKRQGRPWTTRLPRHRPVVARIETIDEIAGTKRARVHRYHDGRFDGDERQFAGFGQVDTIDVDPDASSDEMAAAPAMWRTWYHLGSWDALDDRAVDFYAGDPGHFSLPPPGLVGAEEWSTAECREAYRALSGVVWRQEYYALNDEFEALEHPQRTVEHAYEISRLQPSSAPGERDAVFGLQHTERLAHEYEGGDEPRVLHDLQLEVDEVGNVRRRISVAYPRRDVAERIPPQEQIRADLVVRDFTNVDDAARYEPGIEWQARRYELTGLSIAGSPLDLDDVRAAVDAALADPLRYDESPAGGVEARLLTWQRNLFCADGSADALPPGDVGETTLLHHVERAVLPGQMVADVFDGRVDAAMLDEGHLREQDGYWWAPETIYRYRGGEHFHRLEREERPDGGVVAIEFDDDFLVVTAREDGFGNRAEAVLDRQTMAASRRVDINGNVEEVRYDPFGFTIARTVRGTTLGSDGVEHPVGDEPLTEWSPPDGMTFGDFANEPAALLQSATTATVFDVERWSSGAGPPRVLTVTRTEHVHDGEGGGRVGDMITSVRYFDGLGRALQTKTEAGGGEAVARGPDGGVIVGSGGVVEHESVPRRWLTSGHRVYDRKGLLLRQYEPFFSAGPDFEPDEELRTFGVATTFRYDAAGREIRRESADGTISRVEYGAWSTTTWDANDAVVGSDWEADRSGLPAEHPRRRALEAARQHADTPTTVHFDAAGRAVRTVERGEDGETRVTERTLDLRGLPTRIVDPRDVTAFEYAYDMLERVVHETSADAGEAWMLPDSAGRTIRRWDGRGVEVEQTYDANGRLTRARVTDDDGTRVVRRHRYGDEAGIVDATARNLRGRLVEVFDDAGRLSFQRYDHTGSILEQTRRVRDAYADDADWTEPDAIDLRPELHRSTAVYDALGRTLRRTLPDGTTRQRGYDLLGNVVRATVSTDDGQLVDESFLEDAEFNARGQRSRALLGNDVELRHDFDPATYRLTRLRVRRTTDTSTRRYMDIAYTYDPVGNITGWVDRVQEPDGGATPLTHGVTVTSAREFEYDPYYQLVRATGRVHQALQQHDYRQSAPGADRLKGTRHLSLNNGAALERYTRTYSYDLGGNLEFIRHEAPSRTWKTEIWTAADSNRSTAKHDVDGVEIADPESFFDENGNAVALPHLRGLEWNWANRLSKAVVIDRSDVGGTDDADYYVYGADGRRVRKVTERVVGGGVEITDVVYFGDCEIREVRTDTNVSLRRKTSHLTDGSSRIATLHRWDVDDLASETDDLDDYKLHYRVGNQLGSVVLELAENGDVISYEEYFPYGGTSFLAGDDVRDVKLKEYRYSGKLRDDTTGLYYYEYRYFAPFIGNWLSPDPAGPVDGLNLYRFVRNNPINFVDPDGLDSHEIRDYRGDTTTVTVGEGSKAVQEALENPARTRQQFDVVDPWIREEMPGHGAAWHVDQQTWIALPLEEGGGVFPGTGDGDDTSGGAGGGGTGPGSEEAEGDAGGSDTESDSDSQGGGGTEEDDDPGPRRGDGTDDEASGNGPESGDDGDSDGGDNDGRDGDDDRSREGAEDGSPDAGPSDQDGNSGDGDTQDGGENSSGNTEQGAVDVPPVPEGLPTGPDGIPFSEDIDLESLLDGEIPSEGETEAGDRIDPRGSPGVDGGSANRPGGQQGGAAQGTPGGGNGAQGGTSEGEGRSGNTSGKRGLKGGRGEHELPEWLSWLDTGLDVLQVGLDIVGLIPGVGEIADGINGLISLARGDYVGAALSFGAMIPFAGWGATATKFGRNGLRAVDAVGDVGGTVRRFGDEGASLLSGTTRGADEAASGAGLVGRGERRTLIHYTDEAGHRGILDSGEIWASTGSRHARFGDGQYFTDIVPEDVGARVIRDLTPAQIEAGQISLGQLSSRIFRVPWNQRKLSHFIEIDVTDLPISNPRPGTFLHETLDSLDISSRIIRSGPTL